VNPSGESPVESLAPLPAAPPVAVAIAPFHRHLRRAGELIGARRLPEGELEILKALALVPGDLRALKLLALVRFKLGRLGEAREAYQTARAVAPQDPAVRLNLGLVALKLDWFEEAIAELEAATRLGPDDTRAWSYLGYAYARTGATGRAALAFRRAGQPEVAAELEQGRPGTPAPAREAPPPPASAPAVALTEPARPATAIAFAYERLLSPGAASEAADALSAPTADVLRLAVAGEAHGRQGALLATVGELAPLPARRRRQGRLTELALGAFVRYRGTGELWLTLPAGGRGLVPLTLDQDVLYLREERVVAWGGDVVWEAGCVPGGGPDLLQFRGSGQVVVDAGTGEVVALRVPEGEVINVAPQRLLGWMGRVVAQGIREAEVGGMCVRVACEGEGVLLLSKHGDSAQPVHQRPQPGDHGPGAAGPGGPAVHR
jgi:hypothetical protein